MDFDVWAPLRPQGHQRVTKSVQIGYKQGFPTYKNSWQSCENTHAMQRNTKYMMEILSAGVAFCMFLIQRASSLVREKAFLALFSSHDWVVVSTNFANLSKPVMHGSTILLAVLIQCLSQEMYSKNSRSTTSN